MSVRTVSLLVLGSPFLLLQPASAQVTYGKKPQLPPPFATVTLGELPVVPMGIPEQENASVPLNPGPGVAGR
jgi:hypothetical protein